MKTYLVRELTPDVKEVPEGVIIDGTLFPGITLEQLMPLVSLPDTLLDAVNAFCRRLPDGKQIRAIGAWMEVEK